MFNNKKVQAAVIVFLTLCALTILRVAVVGAHHIDLSDAIYVYHVQCIENRITPTVDYSDKEALTDTLLRWWDWSNRKILDPYQYKIIYPYIGKADSSEFLDQYFGGREDA